MSEEKIEIMNPDSWAHVGSPSSGINKTLLEAAKIIQKDAARMVKEREDRRRLKILMIGEEMILNAVLQVGEILPGFVLKLADPSIPEGLKITRVHHEPWDRCIGFLVEHPSFPVVPDGAPLEKIWPRWEYVELHPKKDDR